MIAVLNMDLEPIRLVLANEVERIQVCEDRRRASGALYTVVSLTAPDARRTAASYVAGGAFDANGDFLGSASQGEALHLVFRYRPENLLASRESLLGQDFLRRRIMAESFLAACAETQLPPELALLLLNNRCVNLSETGEVYFNYFLDFTEYRTQWTQAAFCRTAADRVFGFLSRAYEPEAEGQLSRYPRELVAFYRKTQAGGFATVGAIMAAVRAMPDHPEPPHRGLRLLWDRILALLGFVRRHSMAIFLTVLVCITVVYAAYQITIRVSAQNAVKQNTAYGGMQTIGEVSLVDETA